jgi:RNA recognition motif-containing protein
MKKLYIGNLAFSATEEQLNDWFAQVGVPPSNVNLIRDRFTGQSRGFAFVEVNDEDVERAINSLNGQNFGGRSLVVNEARPQAERGGGGGGRPGGGGGGYGGRGGGGGGRGDGGGRGGDRGGDRGNRW